MSISYAVKKIGERKFVVYSDEVHHCYLVINNQWKYNLDRVADMVGTDYEEYPHSFLIGSLKTRDKFLQGRYGRRESVFEIIKKACHPTLASNALEFVRACENLHREINDELDEPIPKFIVQPTTLTANPVSKTSSLLDWLSSRRR